MLNFLLNGRKLIKLILFFLAPASVYPLFWTVQGGFDTTSFDADSTQQYHTDEFVSAAQSIAFARFSTDIGKKYNFDLQLRRDPVLRNIAMADVGFTFNFLNGGIGVFAGTSDLMMSDIDFGLSGRFGVFFEDYISANIKISCSIDGNNSSPTLHNPFRAIIDANFGWLVLYNINIMFAYVEKWYSGQISLYQQIDTKNRRLQMSIEFYKDEKVYPSIFSVGYDIVNRAFSEKWLGKVENPEALLVFVGAAHNFEFTPLWSWYVQAEFALNLDNIASAGQHWRVITGISYKKSRASAQK
ncbi:MAG: hypothetical protein Ta2B_03800 [Termitinemataceae bacterium]|nr:MAG: hypothetical protein Ta2B_03800 [Termitinemataceae bacterium]